MCHLGMNQQNLVVARNSLAGEKSSWLLGSSLTTTRRMSMFKLETSCVFKCPFKKIMHKISPEAIM
jgi:hypothetical protein